MKRRTRSKMKTRTKTRTTRVMVTSLVAVTLLSTSIWAIASNADELGINKTYLSSAENVTLLTSIPEVTKETILDAAISKETISYSPVTGKELIANGKAYTIATQKAKQEEIKSKAAELAKKVEETRLAKVAEEKAAKEEVERLAKVAKDKADKEAASKIAQIAADKAKQEEIDRIAAERADTSKQATIAANYKIAKAASDKAEQSTQQAKQENAASIAKTESDRIAKIEADRLAKLEADSEANGAGSISKEEVARLAKIEATRLAKVEADRLAKIEANKTSTVKSPGQTAIGAKLVSYLTPAGNVSSVLNRAVALHGGDASNTCVYFSSEAMRRIGVSVPEYICNTRQYLSYLKSNSWVSTYDITKLTPGSVCFTTNDWAGYPTHTFVFMGWVNPGDYSRAYIADNQGNTVHVRNMGATYYTDAFAYFMHN